MLITNCDFCGLRVVGVEDRTNRRKRHAHAPHQEDQLRPPLLARGVVAVTGIGIYLSGREQAELVVQPKRLDRESRFGCECAYRQSLSVRHVRQCIGCPKGRVKWVVGNSFWPGIDLAKYRVGKGMRWMLLATAATLLSLSGCSGMSSLMVRNLTAADLAVTVRSNEAQHGDEDEELVSAGEEIETIRWHGWPPDWIEATVEHTSGRTA